MPNGGMPVFTLIATGWRYRKIFFYKKSTADQRTAVCAVRSAGGTGVLLNIDRLRGRLSSLAAGAKLRGIADSGWFLDNRPYRRLACSDALLCSPADSVRRGIR